MRVRDVRLTERAYGEYAEHAGAGRLSAPRLREKLRSAAAIGDGAVAEWRGARVIFLEGAYWSFVYDGVRGVLTMTGCAAILTAIGFRGAFRSTRAHNGSPRSLEA